MVALILWGLPRLGIIIPLPWMIVILVALGVFAVLSFWMGSRILSKEPLIGLSSMVGTEGKAVGLLAPGGFVKIGGELWQARTDGGDIPIGAHVKVVGQEGLKLTVHNMAEQMSGRELDSERGGKHG